MITWLRKIVLALATVLVAGGAASARAQSIWIPRDHPHAVLLEAIHPSIELLDTEFPSGAAYMGARVRIGTGVSVVAELPYARLSGVSYEYYPYYGYVYGQEGSTFGNPYLGLEVQQDGSIFFLEIGARAPLADRDELEAVDEGAIADYGRFDAFTLDAVPIHLVANVREVTPSGFMFRFRLGPMMVYPTKDKHYRDNSFYALFAWQIGYEAKSIRAGTAITGTSLLDDNAGNLGARTNTSFEAHADFGPWKIRPGADLKVPIGSAARLIPVVLGVSVGASW